MVTWSLEQIDYLFAGGLKDSFLISLRAWCRKIRRKWSYRIIGRLGLLTIIIADKCGKALAVNDMVRDKDQLTGHLPNQNRGVDFLLSGYNDQLKSVGCKVGFGQANMRSEQIFGAMDELVELSPFHGEVSGFKPQQRHQATYWGSRVNISEQATRRWKATKTIDPQS